MEVLGLGAVGLARCGELFGDSVSPALVALLEPVGIVEDESVRRVEDPVVRAIVLREDDDTGPGEVSDKDPEVRHRRAAPAVDCLIVIANGGDVRVPRAEQLHDLELGPVRVLELVDEDVLVLPLEPAEHVRSRAQEPEGVDDLVAEVDGAARAHQLLVLRIGSRELELLGGALPQRLVLGRRAGEGRQAVRVGRVLLGRDVLVLAAADQGDERLEVSGRITQRPVALERQLEEPVAEEDDLLGAVQDAEVGLEPELEGVLAQQPVTERVEGGNLDVRVPVGHEGVDALFHLGRGLVGEGERQDLFGPGFLLGNEPGDAAGDDGGLARARAGNDEEGAGVVCDGLALRVVQAVEDAVRRHPPTTILRRDQRRTSGPPPRTSSTSRGVTSAMSPHIEHLRAPTAVPTSTASWSSRFWSTAQRNPAT